MDIRQSPQHARYLRSIGWIVDSVSSADKKNRIQIFFLRVPILNWHFAKLQRYSQCPDQSELRALFKQYRVFAFSFEPGRLPSRDAVLHEKLIRAFQAKLDKGVYVPSATLKLDLSQSPETLRKQFDANARRLTRPRLHDSVQTVIQPVPQWPEGSVERFWNQGKQTNKHWHLSKNLFQKLTDGYGKQAHLAVSMDKTSGEWLSGILLLNTKDELNYFQAWAGPKAREQGTHFWTVWNTLEYGKKLGCTLFDFEGMYDSRFPRKSWQGFSRFKQKFGGEFVEFPGCFTRFDPLAPFFW